MDNTTNAHECQLTSLVFTIIANNQLAVLSNNELVTKIGELEEMRQLNIFTIINHVLT